MILKYKKRSISTVINGEIILRRRKRCGDGWSYYKVGTIKRGLLGWMKALWWLYANRIDPVA